VLIKTNHEQLNSLVHDLKLISKQTTDLLQPKFAAPGVDTKQALAEPDLANIINPEPQMKQSEHQNTLEIPTERQPKLSGRAKELTIEEVISKVGIWRQLWSGVLEDGQVRRYSLDEAAKKVKISRKTLDDYLLQMRLGKKYGFDFKNNQSSLIGVLRRYVRKQRTVEKIRARESY